MNIIPPSFNFKGDRQKSISLKAQALQFYTFVFNQAELGGVSLLTRTRILPDGSTIVVTTNKEGMYGKRYGYITITSSSNPTKVEIYNVFPTYKPSSNVRRLYKNQGLQVASSYFEIADSFTNSGFKPANSLSPYDGSWTNHKNKATRWRHISSTVEITLDRKDKILSIDMSSESSYLKLISAGISETEVLVLIFYNTSTSTVFIKTYNIKNLLVATNILYSSLYHVGSEIDLTYDPANSRGTQLNSECRSILFLGGPLGIYHVKDISLNLDFTSHSCNVIYTVGSNPYNNIRRMNVDKVGFELQLTKEDTPGTNVSIQLLPVYNTTATPSWSTSAERFLYESDYNQNYYYYTYITIYGSYDTNTYLFVRYKGTGIGDTFFDLELVLKYKGSETILLTGVASIIGFINSSNSINYPSPDFVKVRAKDLLLFSGRIPDYSGLYYYVSGTIDLLTGLHSISTDINIYNRIVQGAAITI